MAKKAPILLVVDDSAGLRRQFKWNFEQYEVVTAENSAEAITMVRRHEPDVVTLDLGLPPNPDSPEEGFKTLREILKFAPNTKVIALTGQNDRANAIQAIALGAHDFIDKPLDVDRLTHVLSGAFRVAELEKENQRLATGKSEEAIEGLITRDPAMLKLCQQIEKLAPTDVTVLLLGESGTGKEILARALHEKSNRSKKPFVAINCAAIPETLLESELFGHERGAFTGANAKKIGKVEQASGGTLFLDETGDLPMSLQAKLLRFLQERVIERLGGTSLIPVDVRVVCATHQNLRALIDAKEFREDLFYRLSEITIDIPPLRNRIGDAVLLSHAMVKKFTAANKSVARQLSQDAIDAIESHAWPGNVRELENCIKRAVIMAEGNTVTAADLGLSSEEEIRIPNLREVRESAERDAICQVLARVNGNVSNAAEILGVSRPTLYYMMNRYGMR
ncbi:MAG: PEP-CTERM-box response regulator transcription factor [Burkholderiaceae bacterium]